VELNGKSVNTEVHIVNNVQLNHQRKGKHLFLPVTSFRIVLTGLLTFFLAACDSGGSSGASGSSAQSQYTITPSVSSNGSISPASGQAFNNGDRVEFTLTPDDLYTIASVAGTCGGSLSGNVHTTDALTRDCTLDVSFGPPDLELTPSAIKNFSFSWKAASAATEYRLLENQDGMSGYTEVVALNAGHTSHELQVFLPERINARYMLTACNNDGCMESEPVFVAGTLAESVGYIKPLNPEADELFSLSLALSQDGNILAVGAPGEDSSAVDIDGDQSDNTASESGAVYVFTRNNDQWLQQAYLKASNTDAQDGFGESLAIASNGNALAVGAPNEASNAIGINGDQSDNSNLGSGAVYLFTRSGETWGQQSYLKASNAAANDRFGSSVTLSEDGITLAVGAIGESGNATGIDGDQANNSASSSGSVYIFTLDADDWSQQAYLKASNTGAGDAFGWSVSLASDGDTLVVGAVGESSSAVGVDGDQSDNSFPVSGAVYVFHRDSTNWSQQAYIKASNTGVFERFGGAIALAGSGNTLAVGAYFENQSLALSGAVYVFNRSGTDWSQQAYLKASNIGANDRFGASLALTEDGNTLAVGALFESSNAIGIEGDQFDESASKSGAVYLFSQSDGSWVQQSYIKASSTGPNDHFGNSIAVAGDGSTLAVGAYQKGGSSTEGNGDHTSSSLVNSGAVFLY
jgi:hypothetical protein